MQDDLELIKKHYGEEMKNLCRYLFPTVLNNNGILFETITEYFAKSRQLVKDIKMQKKENEFKNFIMSIIKNKVKKTEQENIPDNIADPYTLLKSVGYKLYKCTNENNVQHFIKYYAKDEKLCTFFTNRLLTAHVYFVVKKNVNKIKRDEYNNPDILDDYSLSVISIQFAKDETQSLSIISRYNHSVKNPNATYHNDLDKIVKGLTKSFAIHEHLEEKFILNNFYLANYTIDSNNKYYKYNLKIGNTYYCPNNVVITENETIEYPKERYILADYFLIDLKEKKVTSFGVKDSFPKSIGKIESINIYKNKDTKNQKYKIINFKISDFKDVYLVVDDNNNIIRYVNNNVKTTGANFMDYNISLISIEMDNLLATGNGFLQRNIYAKDFKFDKLMFAGTDFFAKNTEATKISLPSLTIAYDNFFKKNEKMRSIQVENLAMVQKNFCLRNKYIRVFNCPKLEVINDSFFVFNEVMTYLTLGNIKYIGNNFLLYNQKIDKNKYYDQLPKENNNYSKYRKIKKEKENM